MDQSVRQWIQTSRCQAPLPERTVLELARRIQRWQRHPQGPDHAPRAVRAAALRARDRLVQHNLALVAHTWRQHHRHLPADALQEGALNLVRAAEKFDPQKGYRFSTYACFWIRRGLFRFEQKAKRLIAFPEQKAALMIKAQQLIEEHQRRCGAPPAMDWLSRQLSSPRYPLTATQLRDLLTQWHNTQVSSWVTV